MNRGRFALSSHQARLGPYSRTAVSAASLLVAACSLQDLGHLNAGRDAGLGGSLTAGTGGRGGSAGANGGRGGTSLGGSSAGGAGAGGSAGDDGAGGTAGSSGGAAGAAPINYGGTAGFLPVLGDGGPDGNLIEDPGFEAGIGNWVGQGSPALSWTTEGPLAGTRCLRATNRIQAWMGPSYHLKDAISAGATYHLSAYIRVSKPNHPVRFSTKELCEGQTTYNYVWFAEGTATTSWRFFEGDFVAPTCPLTEFRVFAEDDTGGVDIFLDEVRVVPVD